MNIKDDAEAMAIVRTLVDRGYTSSVVRQAMVEIEVTAAARKARKSLVKWRGAFRIENDA